MRGFYTCLALTGFVSLITASASSTAQEPAAINKSQLSGLVVDSLGAGVPYAQVFIDDGNHGATADEDGRFYIGDLRPGKLMVLVRRVGFDPVYFTVTLPEAANVQVRVRMRRNIIELSTVDVTDRDPLRKLGFYDRMAAGNGHFISPAMLAHMRPLRATDAFMSIPNVVVDRRGNRSRLVTSNLRCEYAIVIDRVSVGRQGSRVRSTSPDDLVSASDLYAIEVYPRNRGLPVEFLGMSDEDGCGTVVIWTKGVLPR